ncbi:hypothetical protein BDN72DRAFT_898647 [Pluteus cervinus]|uniref:Uncharacterized protein n=1 Tax=Pluteus cervinus TaxID=181527 RepID=A0ACD3ARF3_9AGAR|nr:hypothetical protein BDN72DRAFT_898647 [Pluteus cervinus]
MTEYEYADRERAYGHSRYPSQNTIPIPYSPGRTASSASWIQPSFQQAYSSNPSQGAPTEYRSRPLPTPQAQFMQPYSNVPTTNHTDGYPESNPYEEEMEWMNVNDGPDDPDMEYDHGYPDDGYDQGEDGYYEQDHEPEDLEADRDHLGGGNPMLPGGGYGMGGGFNPPGPGPGQSYFEPPSSPPPTRSFVGGFVRGLKKLPKAMFSYRDKKKLRKGSMDSAGGVVTTAPGLFPEYADPNPPGGLFAEPGEDFRQSTPVPEEYEDSHPAQQPQPSTSRQQWPRRPPPPSEDDLGLTELTQPSQLYRVPEEPANFQDSPEPPYLPPSREALTSVQLYPPTSIAPSQFQQDRPPSTTSSSQDTEVQPQQQQQDHRQPSPHPHGSQNRHSHPHQEITPFPNDNIHNPGQMPIPGRTEVPVETRVVTPVQAELQPASDFDRMSDAGPRRHRRHQNLNGRSETPPASEPLKVELNPFFRFFHTLYNMPWIARDRITVDYSPPPDPRPVPVQKHVKPSKSILDRSWYLDKRRRRASRASADTATVTVDQTATVHSRRMSATTSRTGTSILSPLLSPAPILRGRRNSIGGHRRRHGTTSTSNHRRRAHTLTAGEVPPVPMMPPGLVSGPSPMMSPYYPYPYFPYGAYPYPFAPPPQQIAGAPAAGTGTGTGASTAPTQAGGNIHRTASNATRAGANSKSNSGGGGGGGTGSGSRHHHRSASRHRRDHATSPSRHHSPRQIQYIPMPMPPPFVTPPPMHQMQPMTSPPGPLYIVHPTASTTSPPGSPPQPHLLSPQIYMYSMPPGVPHGYEYAAPMPGTMPGAGGGSTKARSGGGGDGT